MIDLHLHTTASDGLCTPAELVRQAVAAGVRTLSVTDHDTLAATPEVRAEAAALGAEAVTGIEITAVHDQRDVHVLGYFIDPDSPELDRFLRSQRDDRVRRVRLIAKRLEELGLPVDIEASIAAAGGPGRSIGRPVVARALVRAGHVRSVSDAFDELLGARKPAFVPRRGASPSDVVALLHRAGGVASLAHPGLTRRDEIIPELVEAGLDAIEAIHGEHDASAEARYLEMARSHGLSVSGGSDYHGDAPGRTSHLGRVSLPPEHLESLRARARERSGGR